MGSKFVVKNDNMLTTYFQSQKKIIPKQVRWQEFLAEFNYLKYKQERGNVVAGALSRREKISSITTTHCEIHDAIKAGMQKDPEAKKLMELVA